MHRIARLLLPLTSIAAVAVMVMLIAPAGAAESSTSSGLFFFGQSAAIDSPVSGNVQVYGGNATIDAEVHGDLLAFGGDVTFGPNGRVTGNVVYAGGRVRGAEGRVGGRIYPLTSVEGAAASLDKTAVLASLLLVWLIAAIVVTLMNSREVRASSVEVRASALHCFTLGLVALTSFVLTAIIFSYLVPYVIGIPLLAALGIFALLTKVYGLIAVFHAVGTLAAGARTREQLTRRTWLRGDLAMTVIGVLILGLVRLIPVVGTIVWGLASVFGVGVALATKFGRREPWFLAWRPAEV
jgi:hypothetical protein